MALGVLLMSLTRGYQPELLSYLFGSILTIRSLDVLVLLAASAVILFWFWRSLRALLFLSLSEDSARVFGISVSWQTFFFYLALALATVLGVKMLGIILVSALLVLPPATARLMSTSFRSYVVFSIFFSELSVILGILFSFLFDIPTGAAIVLVGAAIFFMVALVNMTRRI
jgi:zinc transport system permease protein